MQRALVSTAGLVLAAVLLVAINLLAGLTLKSTRIDLTADRLYTLSAGTKSILTGIKEPITLRFYFSDKIATAALPQLRTYANRVRELLEEYSAQSGGKLRLEVIDPEPFTDAEDRAVQAGLQGAPIDNAGTQTLYFGLVGTNSTDDQQTIAFFQQEKEPFLEYDLTKLVYNLSYPKKPVVGLISGLPQANTGPAGMSRFTGQPDPWGVMEQLSAVFTVKALETSKITRIDPEIRVLLLIHPKGLSDDAMYAIDQFVLGGGKAVVLVDPHSEAANASQPQNPMMMMPQMRDTKSELPTLFDAWGIELVKDKVVGDRFLALRVNTGRGGGRRAIVDYPAWMGLNKDNLADGDVITNDLSRMVFASPGALKKKEGGTTTLTPLAWTTEETQLIDADTMKFVDPETLVRDFKSGGGRQILAARVSGPTKTAFPDGPPKPKPAEAKEGEPKPEEPKADEKKDIPTPHLAESKGPINLVVVADTDFLDDRFWLQVQDFFGQRMAVPSAGNGDFLVNAVDNLAGSSDLIGLRSRGKSQRPFTVVEQLRRGAEVKFLAQEKELQSKLEAAEKKIAELRKAAPSGGTSGGAALVSDEQKQAMDQFRAEVLDTRKQLRDVQRNLRSDIERLATELKFVNIGLVPVVLVVLALIAAAARRRRRMVRAA